VKLIICLNPVLRLGMSIFLHLPLVVTYEADYKPYPFFYIALEMCALKDEFLNEKGR
jgi:hypothetical protein